ncbi:MAG: HAMP domain-containing histidine kinase [Calditerrivibrio sp.]|nr:HAMP domain-containing histidine kinase [Calditerrivibrio sp.]
MLLTKSFKKRIVIFVNFFVFVIFVIGIFVALNLNRKLIDDELHNLTYLNYKTIEKTIAESILYDDIYNVFSTIEGLTKNSLIFSNIIVLDKNGEYIADGNVSKKVPNISEKGLHKIYDIKLNESKIGSIIFELSKDYIDNKMKRSFVVLIGFHVVAYLLVSFMLIKSINYLMTPLTDLTNKLESADDISNLRNSLSINPKDPKEIYKLKEILLNLTLNLTKQIEKNIEQEKEILKRDKILSIGMMAAGLAHHLKNPIMTIKLLMNPLKDEIRSQDAKNDIEVINAELNRMLNLINDFMCLSKDLRIDKGFFLLSSFFEALHKRILGLKMIKFDFVYEDIYIYSNMEKLIMIFENLISNSINANAKCVYVKVLNKNDKVIFEYSDDGSGVPDNIKDKIFIPFFTTRKDGTGLGLAYVENLVHSLGGDIYLDKNYGNGAKFVLEFKNEEKSFDSR